jgi:hypothetical protein
VPRARMGMREFILLPIAVLGLVLAGTGFFWHDTNLFGIGLMLIALGDGLYRGIKHGFGF